MYATNMKKIKAFKWISQNVDGYRIDNFILDRYDWDDYVDSSIYFKRMVWNCLQFSQSTMVFIEIL